MGTGKRIVLAGLGICGLLSGILLILLTLGTFTARMLLFAGRLAGDLSYTLLGALLFVLGVIFLFFSVQDSKKKEGNTILSFTEIGEVRISFQAIENMVLTASRKVKGIREVSTRLNFTEQGLIIYLRIKAIPDVPIPALVDELQGKVREYVQEISGSNVAEVKVLVENIAQEQIEKKVR
ncbi:MAG: alkaline shock response membrane anchor protein AmaP [Firmicutes bacterium]|nr:alkaline shock response membrane anchor protein AmaP [Bacillota bacterium]